MVMKSTTGCSISSTVVDLPWSTVMHGDFPSRSVDKPPENIVNVSLCYQISHRKWIPYDGNKNGHKSEPWTIEAKMNVQKDRNN